MMPNHRLLGVSPRIVLIFALACGSAVAQGISIAPPPAQDKPAPEMTTRDEQATFRSRVNLVMVPVVVRDNKGKTVAGLKQEDFILSERGKPQVISRFSVEKSSAQNIKFAEEPDASPAGEAAARAQANAPQRFIAYLFDDVHAGFGDIARARDAAMKHMNEGMVATDRAGIFTTSGRLDVEFTDERDKLRDGLMRLQPNPIARSAMQECPDISLYMADMMVNKNDTMAIGAAVSETIICDNLQGPSAATIAQGMAMAAAHRVVDSGTHETRVALDVLRQLVRRMGTTPGQRIIVLASPGFLSLDTNTEKMDIIDRAIKSSVIINGLDIRGLWTDPSLDASRRAGPDLNANRIKDQYMRDSARADSDVLAEMAYGTGGRFFENNNDLKEGFTQTAGAPETFYLLGFSPQNLKLDGTFHNVKVTLKPPGGHYDLQARKGYYAPKHINDEAENAKAEIEEALFSREDLRELPIALHTQFFKGNDGKAIVTVIAHLDVKKFRFKKDDGRNVNQVTVVSGLFDRNGTLVEGIEKILDMKLKDDTLDKRVDGGLTVRTQFSVKPGTYLVRLVVRDKEGSMISAQNSAVDIQ